MYPEKKGGSHKMARPQQNWGLLTLLTRWASIWTMPNTASPKSEPPCGRAVYTPVRATILGHPPQKTAPGGWKLKLSGNRTDWTQISSGRTWGLARFSLEWTYNQVNTARISAGNDKGMRSPKSTNHLNKSCKSPPHSGSIYSTSSNISTKL